MSGANGGGFTPQWADPSHAAEFWFRDAMHFPAPVTPLNATFLQTAFSAGASAAIARLSMPITALTVGVHHGHVYLRPRPFQGDAAATAARFAEMQRLTMEHGATVLRDWYETFEPRVLDIAAAAAGFDWAAPTPAIARHLCDLHGPATEVWDIHMRVNIPPMNAVFGFEEMIGQTLGEAAVAESRGLLQGFDNKSLALGHALWELAEWVRGQDGLAALVLGATVRQGRVALPPHPQAAEFAARLAAFLDIYGWRSDVFGEYGHPSWREDPSTALVQLKGFLADPAARSPYARQAEERARRAALERDFAARLPEPARPAFAALLPLVQQYVPVSEDHNFTIDQKFTVVTREAFLQLGRRLVAEGRLADAEDVFFLVHDEIGAIAEGRADDLRPAVAARRRARAAQARMQAPPFIGTPPPADVPPDPLAAKFFGLGIPPSTDPKLITGHPVSAGTATGTARIVVSLDQADKLQPGDIMVCRMTMPAWTPLFAQVAAVVADTGGALSHCAIVAREYGLPCVAGTAIGTTTIPDGARIHVNGSAGTVQVLD